MDFPSYPSEMVVGDGEGGGCLPCTPSNVRVQSVGHSEHSVGSHQTDSVASNPRGLRVCVSSLFADVQQHLAIVSPSPGALLYGDKCCVINFLKLHLLNYAEYHCDSSCISSPFKEKNALLLLLLLVWGRKGTARGDTVTAEGRQGGVKLARTAEEEKVME